MGLSHLLTGFSLLSKPGIRLWVAIPLLINIVLFAGITLLAVDYFNTLLDSFTGWLPDWLAFVAWLIWALFGLTLMLVYGYTFTIFANLIGSPFYGVLAERTQHTLGYTTEVENLDWVTIKAIAWRSFVREVRKLVYFLPRILGILLLCLILSFIPLLNLATPFIVFLWGAWSMSLQFLDYPADINQMSFDALRQEARGKKSSLFGFGSVVLLGTSIPLINLLVLPAAVTGATSLWLEEFSGSAGPGRAESELSGDESSSVSSGIVKVGKG